MAKILIIDDEAPVRRAICRILEGAGHVAVSAGNGREGLAKTEEETFDLVITDVLMPEMDGIEVMVELRERQVHVPIVAMSGGGGVTPSELLLDDADALGAVTTLAKPFEMAELLRVVESVLRA